jgi:hypothetical protein
VLAHEFRTPAAQNSAQDDRHDDRVVELAGDRDEVRHEIDRQREVTDEQTK